MAMHPPFISVVVPVYNKADCVSECIESVLAQTCDDFELVLVDDGSKDDSLDICNRFARDDARVRVLSQDNAGPAAARNAGFAAVKGEYVWFVDADDLLIPTSIETAKDVLEQTQADCLFFASTRLYESGKEVDAPLFKEPFCVKGRVELEDIQTLILSPRCSKRAHPKISTGYIAPWTKAVRVEVLRRAGVRFKDEFKGLFEDGMWTLEMLEAVDSCAYTDKPLYRYRFSEDSLLHAFRPDMAKQRAYSFQAVSEWMNATNKGAEFRIAYQQYVLSRVSSLFHLYFFAKDNPQPPAQRKGELRDLYSMPCVVDAASKVDPAVTPSPQRIAAWCINHKSIEGAKLYAALWRTLKSR